MTTGGERLSRYVKKIMEEKHLTIRDVEIRSGGGIADAYVNNIFNGKVKTPSAVKLAALAKGLGVSAFEVFSVAVNLDEEDLKAIPKSDPWPAQRLIRAIDKIVSGDELTDIVQALLELPAKDLQAVQKFIGSLHKKKPNGKKKKN
jgi:transcriptional regulator with XRE-family HTH domain